MAEFPALPIFTDAFIADTLHLNATQTGAYLMLLMVAWRTRDCALPNDDDQLARFARMDRRQWLSNKDVILSFWDLIDGVLTQKRLIDERKIVAAKREQAKQAGHSSALKRKGRHSTPVPTEGQRKANYPKPKPTTLENPKKDSPRPDASQPEIQIAFSLFNETAKRSGQTIALRLNPSRSAKLKKRLEDSGGIEGWKIALEKMEQSDFLCGRVNGFKPGIDFLLQESSFIKLMEGNYDNGKNFEPFTGSTRKSQSDIARESIAAAYRESYGPRDS